MRAAADSDLLCPTVLDLTALLGSSPVVARGNRRSEQVRCLQMTPSDAVSVERDEGALCLP